MVDLSTSFLLLTEDSGAVQSQEEAQGSEGPMSPMLAFLLDSNEVVRTDP